jgi:hypothetical protein
MDFALKGFSIDNGYINIKNYDDLQVHIYGWDGAISIPDLVNGGDDADGLGAEVLEILLAQIPLQLMNFGVFHPIPYFLMEYLDEKFKVSFLVNLIFLGDACKGKNIDDFV